MQFIPHAIVTRRYYAELGYLFHDAYWSMWSDNELSAVAHRRSAVIEALDIRFAHSHGQFHDDVRSRHEAAAIYGAGDHTFRLREQMVRATGNTASSSWKTATRTAFTRRTGGRGLPPTGAWPGANGISELRRDSHARRLQRFGWQEPIDTLQALISTEPGHRAALDLLATELARQGI